MRGKNLTYYYLAAVILGLMLVHLYISTKSVALKYDGTRLKIKLAEIKSRNRALACQLARIESMPNIEQKAQGGLNMFYPEEINYIVVTGEAK